MSFLSKIFGDANQRYLEKLQPLVEAINALEKDCEELTNDELREKTQEFEKRIADSGQPDAVLTEAFALVREAAKRTLNQRHFDVQLMGGIVLHQGKISEMKTGEGKTLVATLPAYLNALTGKGVHIVTVNDYLARRDTVWMSQIYHLLGMTVGCINHDISYLYDPLHKENPKSEILNPKQIRNSNDPNLKRGAELDRERDALGSFKVVYEFLRPVSKREAYQADITFGTNNEFGFDYLRDNLVYSIEQKSQRGFHFAIVDEVDSILIDEARTPLIISAPDAESTKLYETFSKIVPHFRKDEDFTIEEKFRSALITEKGIEKVEKSLGIKNIYDHGGIRYVHHLEQALRAHVLFHRDKDYVVKDGEVIIVDEFTGRLMPGRRWSEGLHQAVEAKEGVEVQKESRTFATITFQNYFRLYKKLAGMTGTATTSAEEFHKVYNLDVIQIPTHRPMIRENLPDRIYKTEQGRWRAVINEIKQRNNLGQPLLVGTTSIGKNETLSAMLKHEGIPHEILNAKNHEREGEIIAQTGKFGAVTIATNMAGRGVDIILGGYPPSKIKNNEKESGEEYKQWQEEQEKIIGLGGLHVIGTERHEARRIDDQLRGRAGRQGDPGSSQFFISLDDDLVRIFGGDKIKTLMERLGIPEDQPIEHSFISKAIEQAQAKVEGNNFDIRKYVLEFDDIMNKHRETIYNLRNEILQADSKNLESKERVQEYLAQFINNLVSLHNISGKLPSELGSDPQQSAASHEAQNQRHLNEILTVLTGVRFDLDLSEFKNPEALKEKIKIKVFDIYEEKEKKESSEVMRQLEKFVLLRTIDELWVDHLEAMEYLRESVRLRAYGQRDPLVEYKIEGQKMFEQLLASISNHVAQTIFRVGSVMQTNLDKARTSVDNMRPSEERVERGTGSQRMQSPQRSAFSRKVGRNDPCHCGSGKKYKRCHGA